MSISFPGWPALTIVIALTPVFAAETTTEGLRHSEDPQVLLERGKRHFYGVLAPQSVDRAIELYCRAARLGSGEAQYRLGDIYAGTRTGKRDEVLAAAWLLKATLSGYGVAKKRLSRWDLTGVDLPVEPPCTLSDAMVVRMLPAAAPAQKDEPAAAPPAAPPPSLTGLLGRDDIERLVRHLAPDFELNPELVLAVIEVESNFDPNARSPKQAQGLMQLIPATARRFGVADPWDPRENIRGGMTYLRWLLDHFDGDLRLALAGYNAGERAVERHGGVPPYSETQAYVRRVARALGVAADRLNTVDTRPKRPNVFISTPREADRRSDWESRFFDVDAPG
jgi:soluble lytic murein transglycosylase-like protein